MDPAYVRYNSTLPSLFFVFSPLLGLDPGPRSTRPLRARRTCTPILCWPVLTPDRGEQT